MIPDNILWVMLLRVQIVQRATNVQIYTHCRFSVRMGRPVLWHKSHVWTVQRGPTVDLLGVSSGHYRFIQIHIFVVWALNCMPLSKCVVRGD